MISDSQSELNFDSFEIFLGCPPEVVHDREIKIRCDSFVQENFPSPIEFIGLRVKSIDITCNQFDARAMKHLALYIDDCYKPKITINTENQFFPHENHFVFIANINKSIDIHLNSSDSPRNIARNRTYHLYFANQDSSQHREGPQIYSNGSRIPYLRAQEPVNYQQR